MTLTLGQLKNSEQALVALSNCLLPIAIAYRISKVLKLIASELTNLEEARQKLVQKYGTEKDGNIVVSDENIGAFVDEFNPLLSETVEIPFEPFSVDSLPETVNLTPLQLSQLTFFIKEE
jgi:hypothetical protein